MAIKKRKYYSGKELLYRRQLERQQAEEEEKQAYKHQDHRPFYLDYAAGTQIMTMGWLYSFFRGCPNFI